VRLIKLIVRLYFLPQMSYINMVRIIRVIFFPARPFEFVNQCSKFVRIRFKPKLAFHVTIVTKENFFGFVAWLTFFLQFLYYRVCILLAHHTLLHPPTDCRVHYMSTPIGSMFRKTGFCRPQKFYLQGFYPCAYLSFQTSCKAR